jgi:monovalent cation:H+ antiporter, CPA1 family
LGAAAVFSVLDIVALLLSLTAGFGWANTRFARLPPAVGFLVSGLLISVLLVGVDAFFPSESLHRQLAGAVARVNFTSVLMDGLLAFLLFAGALEVDLGKLRDRGIPVAILALAGTMMSTALVGAGFWVVANAMGQPLTIQWALVFGALISPTDPVAVLSILKDVKAPKSLEIELQGESLFNDGVGVILFTVLLRVAVGGEGEAGQQDLALMVLREVGGGIGLGLATGYLAYRGMKAIDDFPVEVLITLALVTGAYALAQHLHMSGPLAVVAAGLLIGDRGPRYAMSQRTQTYVSALWTMIDHVLNALLFLMMGLELVVLRLGSVNPFLAASAIPVVLLARLISVSVPLLAPWLNKSLSLRNVPFLTWAGVRGGISVALALSLPENEAKPTILWATYAVVVFAVLVQATTLGWVAKRTVERQAG